MPKQGLKEEQRDNDGLIGLMLPFANKNLQQDQLPEYVTKADIKKLSQKPQSISLTHNPLLTLSRKKAHRPLYKLTVTSYRNPQTGQTLHKIQQSSEIKALYDCGKMCDFVVRGNRDGEKTLEEMKEMLRNKILLGDGNGVEEYGFVARPVEFLKSFNLGINNSDLLANKLKGLKQEFKSQQISFTEQMPKSPQTLPTYVTNLKIFNTVQQYLKKRPCWLRNVLEYQLRLDGLRGQYTLNQLKNILKYLCFTYRDGPWKHVFCRFGFNPTLEKQATLYQTLMVKIKRKQLQDYEDREQDPAQPLQNDVYDPTFREMPTRYLRIYQLCDIEDKRVEELIKVTAALSEQCNKETGWFSRTQFNNLQKIVKSIREERSKQ